MKNFVVNNILSLVGFNKEEKGIQLSNRDSVVVTWENKNKNELTNDQMTPDNVRQLFNIGDICGAEDLKNMLEGNTLLFENNFKTEGCNIGKLINKHDVYMDYMDSSVITAYNSDNNTESDRKAYLNSLHELYNNGRLLTRYSNISRKLMESIVKYAINNGHSNDMMSSLIKISNYDVSHSIDVISSSNNIMAYSLPMINPTMVNYPYNAGYLIGFMHDVKNTMIVPSTTPNLDFLFLMNYIDSISKIWSSVPTVGAMINASIMATGAVGIGYLITHPTTRRVVWNTLSGAHAIILRQIIMMTDVEDKEDSIDYIAFGD